MCVCCILRHVERRAWPFTARSAALRLFVTCWMIYILHSATNIVREHYLALAVGDHLSFRVDEYQGLHDDLFETPGRGWHINNNPGVSIMAALPYAVLRPLIDVIVTRVERARAASGRRDPPEYASPWPNSRVFFAEAWRRGLDAKFGLAAMAIQAGFMAPVSALAVVGMFLVLRRLFGSDRLGLWLAVLFAFGTPVFFRTGFLNHNLLVGYAAAAGFVALWNPGRPDAPHATGRFALAGLAGGTAVLLDYTGIVMLAGLFGYGLARLSFDGRTRDWRRFITRFAAGAAGPLALLWFYQWASFGDPFAPAQRWMPAVAWADSGYRGLSFPMPDLLLATLFDYRYGLFTSAPLVLLAFAAPWVDRGRLLPRREIWFMLALFAAFWLFCGSVNYGRLQYNTGIRYMTSMMPFLFVLSAVVLVRLPRGVTCTLVVVSVTLSWCLAMHRDVERGLGVLDPVLHVFIGGFELPVLTTLSRVRDGVSEFVARGVSPLPLFALAASLLYGVWRYPAVLRSD